MTCLVTMEKNKTPSSEWLQGTIFDNPPGTWQELQEYVARVFREIDYTEVYSPYEITGVRGTKEVDVYAINSSVVPSNKIACECKYWEKRVEQDVVHGFRSVMQDNGINTGFIISKKGFQSGAYEAANNTPVVLVSFDQFMDLFFATWLKAMSARLHRATDALFPFFDIYFFETFPEFPQEKVDQLVALQEKYRLLFSLSVRVSDFDKNPISIGIIAHNPKAYKPYQQLGITTYRQFFDVLLGMAEHALVDFCTLVGIAPKLPLAMKSDAQNKNEPVRGSAHICKQRRKMS